MLPLLRAEPGVAKGAYVSGVYCVHISRLEEYGGKVSRAHAVAWSALPLSSLRITLSRLAECKGLLNDWPPTCPSSAERRDLPVWLGARPKSIRSRFDLLFLCRLVPLHVPERRAGPCPALKVVGK